MSIFLLFLDELGSILGGGKNELNLIGDKKEIILIKKAMPDITLNHVETD
jgi:hypothetical protein